ncbi:hypothetical protein ACI65C_006357 [Semiaphis heraclei]
MIEMVKKPYICNNERRVLRSGKSNTAKIKTQVSLKTKHVKQKGKAKYKTQCPVIKINTLLDEEDFDYNSRSDYEYDSGSDYLPPSQIHCESIHSDDEVSLKSDINVNQCNESDNESDNPSSSGVSNKQLSIINPKDIIALKNTKAGYNFNASVQCSRKKPINNKRLWDKTGCCIFCEKNVTNFTRHITRKHTSEIEVARYLSFPQGSKDRKILADQLRKRGNFLCNVGSEQVIKPVRRPNEFSTISNAADYLPCKHCYGLYKKKYLYRHEKVCKSIKTELKGRNKAQADAQNLLLTFTETDEQLVKEVFPRMAVDSISLVAKTDLLIKSFGSRYLKCHREKHLVNIVSQKMRTLARLLIQMRNEDPNIKSLLDCLTPKYFDKIIKCTKIVAGYDADNDKFGSPSIVLKMGSALKQCCDIAEFNILKESKHLDLDDTQKKIKKSLLNMRSIIEKQWSYEISTNACKEIYQKKWNKPAYLPLTSDIKIFRDYIITLVSDEELNEDVSSEDELQNQNIDLEIPSKKTNKIFKKKKKSSRKISNSKNKESLPLTKNSKTTSPKYVRVAWTEDERKITTDYFKKHILLKKAPQKQECENLKKKHHLLKDKPWKKIKTFVHNIIKKNNL